MYYTRHITGKAERKAKLTLFIVLGLLMFVYISSQLQPIIRSAVEAQARQYYTRTVDQAVSDALTQGDCSSFVVLTTDETGAVTSIQTDTAQVNRFKTAVSQRVCEGLEHSDSSELGIPLGSLTGIDALAGRGAELKLTLRLSGGVVTDITGSFTQAGINQTRHTLSCVVTAQVFAVMRGYSEIITLSATVPIAESVIVGDTPDSYTYVVGDQSDTIGRVFDYGDPYGEDVSG